MCSRFTLTSKPSLVAKRFGLQEIPDFPARYIIAPTQPVAIIRTGYNKKREFALVRWGLIPDWVKDPGAFTTLINARAETVLEKPSFRNAMKYRRCLFPVNGFYEWKGSRGHRQPYYISEQDDNPIGLAGIWEHWMGAEGSELESAAIITTIPNSDIARIHDRMPVVISPEDYEGWLDCRDGLAEEANRLLHSAPDRLFKVQKVGLGINNSMNEGPDLIVPQGQQELF